MANSRIPILFALAFLPSVFICFQNGIRYLQQNEESVPTSVGLNILGGTGEPFVEESEGALTTPENIENTSSTSSEDTVAAQGSTTTTIAENNEVTEMIIIPVVLIPQESSEEENLEQPLETETTLEQPETEVIGTTTVTEVGMPPPTETVVVNIGEEENIVIQVEAFFSEETGIIATWWSIENEETTFENWGDLENFIEVEFGATVETAIDTSAVELPVNLETIIEAAAEAPPILETLTETQVEIIEFEAIVGTEVQVIQEAEVTVETIVEATVETVVVASTPETETTVTALGTIGHTVSVGGMHANVISVPNPDCKQVQTCQIVRVPGVGNKKVCKNQLVCS